MLKRIFKTIYRYYSLKTILIFYIKKKDIKIKLIYKK